MYFAPKKIMIARIAKMQMNSIPTITPIAKALYFVRALGMFNLSLYNLKTYLSCPIDNTVLISKVDSAMKLTDSS